MDKEVFVEYLNGLLPLRFTCEEMVDGKLNFLGLEIRCKNGGFSIGIRDR